MASLHWFPALVAALWVASASLSTYSVFYVWRHLASALPHPETPPVVMIAPIKGSGPYLDAFLHRLRAQAYPDARIIIAVESIDDPAYAAALAIAEGGDGLPMSLFVAGPAVATGQKVWNVATCLASLEVVDDVVVFVDADTLPSETWLQRLVAPIAQRRADIVSGYRWLLPVDGRWASCIVASCDRAIATIARHRRWNIVWGGSVAARRSLLVAIDIAALWRGAISDDNQMTRAIWAKGVRVVASPGLLVPSPICHDLASAYEFGRRQHVMLRTHLPTYWALVAGVFFVPLLLAAGGLAEAMRGDPFALGALAIVIALAELRFVLRRRVGAWVLQDAGITDIAPRRGAMWLAGFAAPVLHALCFAAALWSRRVRWAGIGYEIVAPQDIRVTRDQASTGL